jgi:hypothetical protein
VVRKAYRAPGGEDGGLGSYLGYCIVVYRDAAEADAVRLALHNRTITASAVYASRAGEHETPSSARSSAVTEEETAGEGSVSAGTGMDARRGSTEDDVRQLPGFVLKARKSRHGFSAAASLSAAMGAQLGLETTQLGDEVATTRVTAGLHPPLVEQLRPLPMVELLRRVAELGNAAEAADRQGAKASAVMSSQESTLEHAGALEAAVRAYGGESAPPRPERHLEGVPLPDPLYDRLLTLLRTLRWPAQNQRAGLSSERCEPWPPPPKLRPGGPSLFFRLPPGSLTHSVTHGTGARTGIWCCCHVCAVTTTATCAPRAPI